MKRGGSGGDGAGSILQLGQGDFTRRSGIGISGGCDQGVTGEVTRGGIDRFQQGDHVVMAGGAQDV